MNIKILDYFLSCVFVILFIFVISRYLFNMVVQISPVSEIPKIHINDYKYEFTIPEEDTFREFDIFNISILGEIEELIQDCSDNSSFTLIKGFNSYVADISNGFVFSPHMLIFIPQNDIHWSDDTYFQALTDNTKYFPETNSLIYHPKSPIIFNSNKQKNIKVIIGILTWTNTNENSLSRHSNTLQKRNI